MACGTEQGGGQGKGTLIAQHLGGPPARLRSELGTVYELISMPKVVECSRSN